MLFCPKHRIESGDIGILFQTYPMCSGTVPYHQVRQFGMSPPANQELDTLFRSNSSPIDVPTPFQMFGGNKNTSQHALKVMKFMLFK